MSTEQARIERLREIAYALPHAVYPNPNWDEVHALEDEAAILLGKRTVRQATDVVSGRELYRLMQVTIARENASTETTVEVSPRMAVPEALRAALVRGAHLHRNGRLGA